MKSRFNKYLLSFCLILICATVFAQKDPDLPGPPPNPGNDLPIDGGLLYLIISGIAYGVYELKRKKE
tara:strand:+ start:2901 stop:3101 length:201 start_codon:yes stop_codon:yes gene_type:complete